MEKMTYRIIEKEDPRSQHDGEAVVLYLRGTGDTSGISRICPKRLWTSTVGQRWREEMSLYGYAEV
jgi:hypothetical protein